MIPELKTINLVDLAGRYTRLRKVSTHEWAGPCPRCGGRDRFRVSDQRGFFCRVCHGEPGTAGAHWGDAADFLQFVLGITFREALQRLGADRRATPAELAALEQERRAAQERERKAEAELQAQVHTRLTSCPDWRTFAANVERGRPERELWHRRGLSDAWIDYYALGYCAGRCYPSDTGDFESPSLTIPYFRPVVDVDPTWRVIGLQHRLLIHDPPGGKYRPHLAGAGKHLFYADLYQRGPTTFDLLIVEGEIKAMVTHAALWQGEEPLAPNLSVVGVPGKGWREDWLNEFRVSPRVYICLDPDAGDSARKLAAEIGRTARVILLPDKIDDLINMGVLDGWGLLNLLA